MCKQKFAILNTMTSTKNKKQLIAIAVIVATFMLAAAIYFYDTANKKQDTAIGTNEQQSSSQSSQVSPGESADPSAVVVTRDELAAANGQDGAKCYVAIDGVVYQISGFAQWADGMHSSSGGRARCGRDLSDVIDDAPHGRSKIPLLKEIGKLQ